MSYSTGDNPLMTKADCLLELLYDEQVLPAVMQIFDKRRSTAFREDLPEFQEFLANRRDEGRWDNGAATKFWERDAGKKRKSLKKRLIGWLT